MAVYVMLLACFCHAFGSYIYTYNVICNTFQMLMEQKTACDSMIDEKNKLIHDFQQVHIEIWL